MAGLADDVIIVLLVAGAGRKHADCHSGAGVAPAQAIARVKLSLLFRLRLPEELRAGPRGKVVR